MGNTSAVGSKTSQAHVTRIFETMDTNHDGKVTLDEFVNYCTTQESVRQSLTVLPPPPFLLDRPSDVQRHATLFGDVTRASLLLTKPDDVIAEGGFTKFAFDERCVSRMALQQDCVMSAIKAISHNEDLKAIRFVDSCKTILWPCLQEPIFPTSFPW
jgi:hypothetical protein